MYEKEHLILKFLGVNKDVPEFLGELQKTEEEEHQYIKRFGERHADEEGSATSYARLHGREHWENIEW